MKMFIIDPEAPWLTQKIGQVFPQCRVIGSHANYREGWPGLLQEERVEAAILCLDLPDANGLELLNVLTETGCEVIISSEWATFAYEALRGGAADYLLKPYADDELVAALQRTARRVTEKSRQPAPASRPLPAGWPGLVVTDERCDVRFLPVQQIVCGKAAAAGCCLELTGGSAIELPCTLDELERQVAARGFLRISPTLLLNLQHVDRFVYAENAFVLQSGERLAIEPDRQADISACLRAWQLPGGAEWIPKPTF